MSKHERRLGAQGGDDVPFVSVVVPVKDDDDGLRRCLEALRDQDYPGDQYEVLVVDNGSRRPPVQIVAGHPRARLIEELTPGSYAARNRGITEAVGEVLAFTDADCTPHAGWLRAGSARVQDPAVGLAVGPVEVVLDDVGSAKAVELFELVHAFPQERYVLREHFGATANVFTRADVVARVGRFDERLQSGGDKEFGKRVHAAGLAVVFEPQARVLHPPRRSWRAYRTKLARTATGELAARANRGELSAADIGTTGWKAWVPPLGGIARNWHHPQLPTLRVRLRYAVGAVTERYLSVWTIRAAVRGSGSRRPSGVRS